VAIGRWPTEPTSPRCCDLIYVLARTNTNHLAPSPDKSWKTSPEPVPHLNELRAGRVLGVDLNADHVAACVLDCSGNPIGDPVTIAVETAGLRASRRDGRVRAAISALLDHAHQQNCSVIVVEDLDFADARAAGRETLGRGKRGKRLRRTVAGIPTARFRTRLTGMAARRGKTIIGVDPAYTSRWGAQHWRTPLQQQASDPATVTTHHGAAAAIGRRGLGLAIRRRPAGPRTRQRTRAGTSPARPDHQPSTTPRRCRSSGSPPRPHDDGACRSPGQHPPPAANTVRAAQDSLLLRNQERCTRRSRHCAQSNSVFAQVTRFFAAGSIPAAPPEGPR
jgi:IS605 OrfB family transposase